MKDLFKNCEICDFDLGRIQAPPEQRYRTKPLAHSLHEPPVAWLAAR